MKNQTKILPVFLQLIYIFESRHPAFFLHISLCLLISRPQCCDLSSEGKLRIFISGDQLRDIEIRTIMSHLVQRKLQDQDITTRPQYLNVKC